MSSGQQVKFSDLQVADYLFFSLVWLGTYGITLYWIGGALVPSHFYESLRKRLLFCPSRVTKSAEKNSDVTSDHQTDGTDSSSSRRRLRFQNGSVASMASVQEWGQRDLKETLLREFDQRWENRIRRIVNRSAWQRARDALGARIALKEEKEAEEEARRAYGRRRVACRVSFRNCNQRQDSLESRKKEVHLRPPGMIKRQGAETSSEKGSHAAEKVMRDDTRRTSSNESLNARSRSESRKDEELNGFMQGRSNSEESHLRKEGLHRMRNLGSLQSNEGAKSNLRSSTSDVSLGQNVARQTRADPRWTASSSYLPEKRKSSQVQVEHVSSLQDESQGVVRWLKYEIQPGRGSSSGRSTQSEFRSSQKMTLEEKEDEKGGNPIDLTEQLSSIKLTYQSVEDPKGFLFCIKERTESSALITKPIDFSMATKEQLNSINKIRDRRMKDARRFDDRTGLNFLQEIDDIDETSQLRELGRQRCLQMHPMAFIFNTLIGYHFSPMWRVLRSRVFFWYCSTYLFVVCGRLFGFGGFGMVWHRGVISSNESKPSGSLLDLDAQSNFRQAMFWTGTVLFSFLFTQYVGVAYSRFTQYYCSLTWMTGRVQNMTSMVAYLLETDSEETDSVPNSHMKQSNSDSESNQNKVFRKPTSSWSNNAVVTGFWRHLLTFFVTAVIRTQNSVYNKRNTFDPIVEFYGLLTPKEYIALTTSHDVEAGSPGFLHVLSWLHRHVKEMYERRMIHAQEMRMIKDQLSEMRNLAGTLDDLEGLALPAGYQHTIALLVHLYCLSFAMWQGSLVRPLYEWTVQSGNEKWTLIRTRTLADPDTFASLFLTTLGAVVFFLFLLSLMELAVLMERPFGGFGDSLDPVREVIGQCNASLGCLMTNCLDELSLQREVDEDGEKDGVRAAAGLEDLVSVGLGDSQGRGGAV